MADKLDHLRTLLDSLQGHSEPCDAIRSLLESISAAGFQRCRYYEFSEQAKSFTGVAQYGLAPPHAEAFKGLRLFTDASSPIVNKTEEPTVIPPVDIPQALELEKDYVSWVDVPLFVGERLYGKLSIDNKTSDTNYSSDDLAFLKLAAHLFSRWMQDQTETVPSPAEALIQFKKRHVLVLGKDTGAELEVLRTIQRKVDELGYMSQLVKDAQEIPEMTNEDKVRAIADASRFVILENSYPAGQIAEMKILSTNRITTAILRQESTGSTWMVGDYDLDFHFMREFVYSPDEVNSAVVDACDWANSLVDEKVSQLKERYPWRKEGGTPNAG